MKKVLIVSLTLALVLAFGSFAMAKKGGIPQHGFPQFSCCPSSLDVEIEDGEVCFDWYWDETVCGTPIKYSIDVELLVSGEDWDDPEADIQELSFGTSDRTDGEPLNAEFLCVPIEEFVYYVWDGYNWIPYQFEGTARFKVKALGKGKSQNNPFSEWSDDFEIEIED